MSSHYYLGAKEYHPVFFHTAEEIVQANKTLLEQLVGENLQQVWIAWSLTYDEAWMDCPVILKFSHLQLELCCNKLDEFSITANTINLQDEINWFGDTNFEWKVFKTYPDKFELKEIRLVEILSEISNVSDQPGYKNSCWSLGGLQFICVSGQLTVLNGLDCNILTESKDLGEGVRTRLLSDFR